MARGGEREYCKAENCERPCYGRGFCSMHYQRLVKYGDYRLRGRMDVIPNFWKRVDKTGGCWKWTGAINSWGYGQFGTKGKFIRAHRFAYELIKGEIPPGLVLDHLCGNRSCVNPDHLEAVTQRVNAFRSNCITTQNLRKTHCPSGHPYNESNALIQKSGWRMCRICHYRHNKSCRSKKRSAGLPIHKPKAKQM